MYLVQFMDIVSRGVMGTWGLLNCDSCRFKDPKPQNWRSICLSALQCMEQSCCIQATRGLNHFIRQVIGIPVSLFFVVVQLYSFVVVNKVYNSKV